MPLLGRVLVPGRRCWPLFTRVSVSACLLFISILFPFVLSEGYGIFGKCISPVSIFYDLGLGPAIKQ